MSKIEVDAIEPQSGTSLTLGASGDTLTIPSGATLVNNGTASGFGDNLEWQSSIVTAATITVTANKGYWIDTTSNACTITLPAAAAVGDRLIFTDYARNWATNAVTINPNSLNFQGNTTPQPVYDTAGESVDIVYSGATKGWIPNTDGAVALETPQSYSADFLVIGGGGGGGNDDSGGGGAGGYRTSTQTVNPGTTYTVTVGDGGAGSPAVPANGANGSASSVSGTGLTTITSAGGGGGGTQSTAGADGGSGGGGSANPGTAGGSGNIPATSPSQGNDGADGIFSNVVGGGGGGAGEAGNTDGPAYGGDGLTSSITGSAVVRAGGGAGSNRINPQTPAPGGDGGGGTGGTDTPQSPATDGTVNTGSGGGGGGGNAPKEGGDGGKGVVIISVPDADYSGTTTGSPTVATGVSGKTVMTFTGDGSYTG